MKDINRSSSKNYNSRKEIYRQYFKRPMDFILSLMAILLLLPLLLITSVFVRLNLGSPIIFKQDRSGLDGKIFSMYKFRTMTDERGQDGLLLTEASRLTNFGKFLRSTSIDELPQLFNIIRGDMSIVGPRPLIDRDIIFMDQRQRRRHLVLPGLTGLAQVNGRNCIEWVKKLELDLEYIEKISFIDDWKIIFLTFLMVIQRKAIAPEGMIIGEPFGDHLLKSGQITREEWTYALNNMERIMDVYFK